MIDDRRFVCSNCGVCCRTFRLVGKRIERDDEGIFYTVDLRSSTMSLWRWEVDRLRKRAGGMDLEVNIKPLSFIMDSKSDRAIIMVWYVDHEICPFHDEERCTVWPDRPFTCKSFPLYGERSGVGLSSKCPDLVRPPLTDDPVENGRRLTEIYPEEVISLFKDMEIYRMIFGFVRDMEENDVIEWDREASVHRARTLMAEGSVIDLFDLVVDEGVLAREEVDGIFEELDSVEDVKGRVDLRVSRDMPGV